MYRTLVDQNQKFSLISQCAFSYMALVLVVFCKVDEKAYWFSTYQSIKIKIHCFFFFQSKYLILQILKLDRFMKL